MSPNLTDENLDVPLIFQAQVEGRCQLQRIKDSSQVYDWVKEWTKEYPLPVDKPSKQPSKPAPKAKAAPNNFALARPSKAPTTVTKQQNSLTEPPQFGKGVSTWKYTIHWRLVTNGGQDGSIIRPVFGSKGYPYYPGSSMKGAFRRACSPEQAARYCGKERTAEELVTLGNSAADYEPGILRFHGGYPIDTAWADPERLVDLVHSQWKKQVIEDEITNANVQISLYQIEMKFGISSTHNLTKTEWEEIKTIWEKALSHGLGSRVSAGYGYFVDRNSETSELLHRERPLLAVKLTGQGLASNLLNKQNKGGEFRPNLFKATLRGHTLRLLGGLTNEKTAIALTEILWGGIGNEDSENSQGIEGLLGVAFDYNSKCSQLIDQFSYVPLGKNKAVLMPVYNLKIGTLKIFVMKGNISEEERQQLRNIAENLIKFSMLFGGFGKSWRRVHHDLFYPEYLNGKKPMIGCHWQFISESESLYIPIGDDFNAIAQFINTIRNNLRTWGSQYKNLGDRIATNWREAWYLHREPSGGVQVWARIAKSQQASLAVKWFHQLGNQPQDLKETSLGGEMGETGRIWHRMYPQYSINEQGELKSTKQYVEILTIFPDDSVKSIKFIKSLIDKQSTLGQFQKIL